MSQDTQPTPTSEILLYTSPDGEVQLDIQLQDETLWMTQQMMADLFQTTVQNIIIHVNNIYEEAELQREGTCKNFLQVRTEGRRQVRRPVNFYNLDMILSVGYRVNTRRGTQFRIWATQRLRKYLLRGYVAHEKRLQQLGMVVQLMRRVENRLDARQVLDVIEHYSYGLNLLDAYDHQTLTRPVGSKQSYLLQYDECRQLIESMRFGVESELFGREKDDSFKGAIGNIYQSFDGQDIYPTMEEKAAHLLYFTVKNHGFIDGNKRIAAAVFLYFLDRNQALFIGNTKRMTDATLVALVILIAESHPDEMETIISVILNCMHPACE